MTEADFKYWAAVVSEAMTELRKLRYTLEKLAASIEDSEKP